MSLISNIKKYFIQYVLKKETKNKYLFDHHFFVNQYYLHQTASLEDMSKILNINASSLNQIALANYAMDFETLCKKYKFLHFWEEFTNPLNAHLPIESIIKMAGFLSNNDFSESILSHKEESKYILEKKYI
jgi:hypothetical protein